ncbi:DENN domain-containing protein Crag isoform X3 [Frankliniella occidentalis]|uniref:DENN domain-containing protein Crag isoform X3 n=1 Tax=Frankliniella occidentalis TaxID=133901 RepID=A0A6J1T6N3_FRAOC|nr:DENN domain-containing protein Crag isoform X3 [Frankliniella occidentalis]
MMDDRRIADYFVVAGLPPQPQHLEDVSRDGTMPSGLVGPAPITDLAVIFPSLGESPPPGFSLLEVTPSGLPANLNHGSYRTPEVFLCYRRGRDKPPLVDIGVMYEGKERIMQDAEVVKKTPYGRIANVNNSTAHIFVTYRRASPTMPCNELVVTDVCVIIESKGEDPPPAFCVLKKNLNKGMVGSVVYLCYKKSMNRANLISYKPDILSRYPRHDLSNFPFPVSVPLFCLPMGASLECWPKKAMQPRPVFSTFVLTVSDASEKVYGSAITFYEPYPEEQLTDEQIELLQLPKDADPEDYTYNVNKCICLLSHWPFFDTFEHFLLFLYSMACSGPQPVPIERYISHFLEDVPFPSPQRPRILVQLSPADRVILTQPEDLPLPRSGARFRSLLINLGPDNCLLVLLCALTEQKILVHSLRPDVLTAVAEAISMIIFPFKWQCPYIPLCPLGLAEVLHAPLPFLIGVDSRFFDLHDPPIDVVCVDLDTNLITLCDEKRNLNTKILPKKPARTLRNTLETLYQKVNQSMENYINCSLQDSSHDAGIDRDFQMRRKEQVLELEIQEAFLRFMASIIRGYRVYLMPITKAPTIGTTDPNSLFNLGGFLRSRDKSYHKFYTLVMKTQMFIRFIEERSFVSDMDAGLAFFDICCEKMNSEDSVTHLIELDEALNNERTVFIMPPEPSPNSTTAYTYNGRFTLNPALFSSKDLKDVKHLLRIGGGRLSNSSGGLGVPGSPMARRTKHEIKSAQKLARKSASSPEHWAKCLVGTCYSLWFIHLPSYIMMNPRKASTCLRTAYDLLNMMQRMKLQPSDEVCYRVMMQLCGVYSTPVLAVKLLFLMKRSGVQPNAITYGFYNRAVLEATWPSDMNNSSQLLWNKLRKDLWLAAHRMAVRQWGGDLSSQWDSSDTTKWRNVIMGAALFRRAGSKGQVSRRASAFVEDGSSGADNFVDVSSQTSSVDSNDPKNIDQIAGEENKLKNGTFDAGKGKSAITSSTSTDYAALDRFRSRVGSIVRPSGGSLLSNGSLQKQPFESSAGLLMTSQYDGKPAPLVEECEDLDALHDSISPVLENGKVASPVNPRRSRGRSGSCSDFTFSNRLSQHEKNPPFHSPLAPHSPKATVEPGSPIAPNPAEHFKILMRSESFANDAGILEKLHKLKLGLSPATNDGSGNGKSGLFSETSNTNGPTDVVNNTRNVSFPRASSVSKALFGRRGSFNFRRTQNSESRESLSENPDERSSAENSRGGSTDDLDSLGSQHTTPTRRLLAGWNNQWNNSQWSSRLWNMREGQTQEQQVNEKNDTSEQSPSRSLPKSPTRTPVTENDPLGALVGEIEEEEETSQSCRRESSEESNNISLVLDEDGNPVLFGGRRSGKANEKGVARSATFHEDERVATDQDYDSGREDLKKTKLMQRSSTITMPLDSQSETGGGGSVAASIGSLGSSFKLPFSRYSPGRFSLRKADLRIGQQIIENAITNFSPSSLTSKKSSELLMGGLNSLKSAATSVAKKFDEIKEAVSANNTPTKATNIRDRDREGSYYDDDHPEGSSSVEESANTSRSRKVSSEFSPSVTQNLEYWGSNLLDLFGDNSRKGSSSNLQPLGETSSVTSQQMPVLPENLYPKHRRDSRIPVAEKLILTTCSKCHNCGGILYDEEIMAGWSPEDSNLNTKCQFCDKATVPFLTITVMDYRSHQKAPTGISQESLHSSPRRKNSGSLSVRVASWMSLNSGSLLSVAETEETKQPALQPDDLHESAPSMSMIPENAMSPEFLTPVSETSGAAPSEAAASSTSDYDTPTTEVAEPTEILDDDLTQGTSLLALDSSPVVVDENSAEINTSHTNGIQEINVPEDGATPVSGEADIPEIVDTPKVEEDPVTLEPITVPYLNPLVLRKELENILHAEGDVCLTRPCFVDEHPIIFWNMVWALERIGVESHLPGLCLQSGTVLRQQTNIHSSWTSADHRHVVVRCMWDNPRLHEEVGLPMYVLWQQDDQHSSLISALLTDRTTVSRPVMEMIIASIRCNDLLEPLRKLATERQKLKGRGVTRSHSIYRDILFLAFIVLGRDNIHQASFDREYENAFDKLTEQERKLYNPCDQPLSIPSLCCRHYFRELEL